MITCLKEYDQGCEGTSNHAMCEKVREIIFRMKKKKTQVDIESIKLGIIFLITCIFPISMTMPNNIGCYQ